MKKGIIEISKDKSGVSKGTLLLENELTYLNVASIKEEVAKNLPLVDQLYIQANLFQIDLTGIQLIYSIKKTCQLAKKQVVLSVKINSELQNLMVRSGFNYLLN